MCYNIYYDNDVDFYDGVDNVNGNIREHGFWSKIGKAFKMTFAPNTSCDDDWKTIRSDLSSMAEKYSNAVVKYDDAIDTYNNNIDIFNQKCNIYNDYINKIYKLQEIIKQFSKDDLQLRNIQIPTFNIIETKNKIGKTSFDNRNYSAYKYTFNCKVYKNRSYSDTFYFKTTRNGFPDSSYEFRWKLKLDTLQITDLTDKAVSAVNNVILKINNLISYFERETKNMKSFIDSANKSIENITKIYNQIQNSLYSATKENLKIANITN